MDRDSRISSNLKDFTRTLLRVADDYRIRVMLCSCLTLLVLIFAVHVPVELLTPRIGWINNPLEERMSLDLVEIREPGPADVPESIPVTDFGLVKEEIAPPDDEAADGTSSELMTSLLSPELSKVRAREVLNFAEEQPEIMGGLSRYYLNIDYPEAAREAGIQGRLILSFIVEPSGRASNIHVEQSLHPLCDSAAVVALERSRFIAGRQDGKKVPVRMRLPVRFKLLEVPDEPVLSEPVLTESRAQ